MSFLKRPFRLGGLSLESNIFCAPLAGCSDLPFRRMTTSYRPGLVYCEMVKMDALVRNDPNTFRFLDYEGDMHPIGAQICGSKVALSGVCAKIIEDLGFDTIDLNCGCPVDKVTKDGSGSGLLKNPQLIGEILSQMVAAVKIPVTVKIRAGWDDQNIIAEEVTRIAEQAGAKSICIHGRTRAQGYQGSADWEHIRRAKLAAKEILVVGNGDLFDPFSVKKIFENTGCDAVLIARGTMGQPWIIEDIYRHLEGLSSVERDGLFYRKILLEHLDQIASYQNEKKAVMDLRRVGCWYLKRGKGARKLREALNKSRVLSEMQELLSGYAWEDIDFSSSESSELVEVEV
ncbi:MAG: tRNA dihydrouridine synthase DusB [Chlamydiales bacterium]|nr:tRNA dihydrouridine synthase DusB [Chlamydiales bacterium]